jgi:hypothetical protein
MKLIKNYGLIGSWLSFTCAVHCLLMPVLISIAPVLILSDGSNTLILVISTMLSLASLCWGFKKHTRVFPILILGLGFLLLNTDCRSKYHIFVSICGGICFVFSYWLNKKFCRSCHNCNHIK